MAIFKEGLGPRWGCVRWHRRGTMSLLLAQRATPRCPLVFRPANKSRAHCSQQPRWKYLCVCACVCALASNLALVTQHTWAARPFLSAGASSSSQGPRRRMKREQMVWGCSEIPAPRAVSSAARALWRAQHAQDQRGLSEDPGGDDPRGVLMASALGWSLGRSGDLWRMMESTRTSSGTRSATTL